MSSRLRPEHIRAVRLGHGANCSSVGSVIDTLFLSAAVGSAIFVAVCAAIDDEAPKSALPPPSPSPEPEAPDDPSR